MPEPDVDEIRISEINSAFDAVDKVLVDEVNNRKLSYIEIEIVLLYLRKKIDTEEWIGFVSHQSEEGAKHSGLYT